MKMGPAEPGSGEGHCGRRSMKCPNLRLEVMWLRVLQSLVDRIGREPKKESRD